MTLAHEPRRTERVWAPALAPLVALHLLFGLGLTLQLLDDSARQRSTGLMMGIAAVFSANGVVVGVLGELWLERRCTSALPVASMARRIVLASLVGSLLWLLVEGLAFDALLAEQVARAGSEPESAGELFALGLVQTLLLAVAHSGMSVVRFGSRARAEREARVRTTALLREAKAEGLRQRLDPHFLLNALNAITDLVERSSSAAGPALAALTELLHHTVREHRELTPLADELSALSRYVHVQSLRYGDDLRFELEIEAGLDAVPCPPLALLTLVENAIKHGFRQGIVPLSVRVSVHHADADRACISVENRAHLGRMALGTGLENLRERVRLLFPRAGSFSLTESGGWVRAELIVPRHGAELDGSGVAT